LYTSWITPKAHMAPSGMRMERMVSSTHTGDPSFLTRQYSSFRMSGFWASSVRFFFVTGPVVLMDQHPAILIEALSNLTLLVSDQLEDALPHLVQLVRLHQPQAVKPPCQVPCQGFHFSPEEVVIILKIIFFSAHMIRPFPLIRWLYFFRLMNPSRVRSISSPSMGLVR